MVWTKFISTMQPWNACGVLGTLLILAGFGEAAMAVSRTPPSSNLNISSPQQVDVILAPPSLFPLEFEETPVFLKPSQLTLRRRLEATVRFPETAESVRIALGDRNLRAVALRIALPSYRKILEPAGPKPAGAEALLESLRKRVDDESLNLDARDLKWVDLSRLGEFLRLRSRVPHVSGESWKLALSDEATVAQFVTFFGPHWQRIQSSVHPDAQSFEQSSEHEGLSALEWLPPHMRESYGRYSAYRGRNCFATALMFADEKVLSDRTVNLVKEENHHRSMINSDEFANALGRGYSLLSEDQIAQGLRFGDVVALRDEKRGEGYRSLLHAVVHIGGDYYFHKPSKSAASPVEFTRWEEIIKVWQPIAGALTFQVFRKNPLSSAQYIDNRAFSDKINWTR